LPSMAKKIEKTREIIGPSLKTKDAWGKRLVVQKKKGGPGEATITHTGSGSEGREGGEIDVVEGKKSETVSGNLEGTRRTVSEKKKKKSARGAGWGIWE